MPLLTMREFRECFRKQFQFQKGKGGMRQGRYYTAYNQERGLKTDTWAMIVFIHTAGLYGFERTEIIAELNIRSSLYDVLQQSIPEILSNKCEDVNLHVICTTKMKLVKNSIRYTHRIKV